MLCCSNRNSIDAFQQGDPEFVSAFIEQGANVNNLIAGKFTPLMIACKGNHTDCVSLLLEAGADVDFKTEDGHSALSLACGENHVECVRILMEHKADLTVSKDQRTMLMLTSHLGHVESLELLLEGGADVNAQHPVLHSTALLFAVLANHAECVMVLLKAGADHSIEGMTPGGLTTPFIKACEEGFEDIIGTFLLLADREALFAQRGQLSRTPLMLAAKANPVCIRALLAAGADIDELDDFGQTALMYLCDCTSHNCVEAVKILLEEGADPHHIGVDRRTALMRACSPKREVGFDGKMRPCSYDYLEVVRTLIDYGADVTQVGQPRQMTALLCACQTRIDGRHVECIRMLLDAGANMDRTCHQGRNSIMRACHYNQVDCVVELIHRGASLEQIDEREKTARIYSKVIQNQLQLKVMGLRALREPNAQVMRLGEHIADIVSEFLCPRRSISRLESLLD